MEKTFIDKLAFIEIKDKKVLSTLSRGKDIWYIPGGKREKDETDEQALIRETKEELSINLVPSSIKYYGTFQTQAHGKPIGTLVRMTCYTAKYTGKITPSSEIEKFDFVSYDFKKISSPVDNLIFDDLKAKGLIE